MSAMPGKSVLEWDDPEPTRPALRFGVEGKPCLRPSCRKQAGYGAPATPHASAFRHAFKPLAPLAARKANRERRKLPSPAAKRSSAILKANGISRSPSEIQWGRIMDDETREAIRALKATRTQVCQKRLARGTLTIFSLLPPSAWDCTKLAPKKTKEPTP